MEHCYGNEKGGFVHVHQLFLLKSQTNVICPFKEPDNFQNVKEKGKNLNSVQNSTNSEG